MGLFGRSKKNGGMFDKNIEPKCAYCENGRPAKTQGKILCPRCGMVDSDYSCKKFKYSPVLRVPEKKQSENTAASHASQTTIANAGNNAVQEKTEQPVKSYTENTVSSPAVNPVSEPVQQQSELPKSENPIVEAPPKSDVIQNKIPETKIPAPKEESDTDKKVISVSSINNKPSDNSENISKLEFIPKATVSSISNQVKPKEINLPKVSESAVSSIENKPLKRDSEGYLKTVSVRAASDFKNHGGTVHHIPPETKIPAIKDMDA